MSFLYLLPSVGKTLSCYGDETKSSRRQCPYPFKVFDDFEYDSSTDGIEIQSLNPKDRFNLTNIFIDRIEPSYCVGPSWHIEPQDHGLFAV